ncbi:hypothetical protein E8M12_12440 [Thalassotalea mangrovi]|uniref:Orphan protein n=1 Tax=Thalassotalea mangrovi TaxID=2572245 RepID=A0A4U1B3B7_9GAMM|nr:hypothetical protein E8M12_12440 [Thalassotalea mangrovi]
MLAIALIVLTPLSVNAHQQKEAYSTVLFNDRTGNLEVAHRFYIHDTEHALSHLFSGKADIISDPVTQQKFAEYIQHKFRLLNQDKALLELGSVGYEVEGKFFWVYQEIPQPENLTALFIQMQALQEIWPGQINQVNVERNGKTKAVRINKDDEWLKLPVNF